ncbi:MAG: aspartate aminotransferase, partial [Planctomycetes bacterium]|nr:aspartate aminotransferase [Planctomycetota bacterium]
MECDFDNIVGRRNTGSVKWDKYAGREIIPMWVADMDFRSPPAVREALRRRVDHGVFGYSIATKELFQVVVDRMARKYDWSIDPSWIVWLPGLVPGINIACRCMGGDGDEALCFVPAYPPFLTVPARNGWNLITVPLSHRDGRPCMDPERFKAALTPCTKLFI